MPRTIESIVENHRVAAERRAAGKPVWDRKIDVKAILHEDQSNIPMSMRRRWPTA